MFKERLISVGLTLILIGAILSALSGISFKHPEKFEEKVRKMEILHNDTMKIDPGFIVSYFNSFKPDTLLNIRLQSLNNMSFRFRVIDEKTKKMEEYGIETSYSLLNNTRLVSMELYWTPPSNQLVYFIFSNPHDEVIYVNFTLSKVYEEKVEIIKIVDKPLLDPSFLELSLFMLLIGIAISLYSTFEVLRKIRDKKINMDYINRWLQTFQRRLRHCGQGLRLQKTQRLS